jgi:hypothetical protein
MVNRGTPCEHGATVRRALGILVVAGTLAACSGGATTREFATYYDPAGLFRTELPAANAITVAPPQPSVDGPGLLTGVIASPPQPSPSAATAFGGASSFVTAAQPTDQTIYEAFAYTTGSFGDLDEMTLFFLTGDPSVDVLHEEDVRVADAPGRLVVADVSQGGAVSASVAIAMTLGSGGTGFVVGAIFTPGTWDAERGDFSHVLASFEPTVPPAMKTYPLQAQTA